MGKRVKLGRFAWQQLHKVEHVKREALRALPHLLGIVAHGAEPFCIAMPYPYLIT